jgi:diguanylate cyclase (GGDEF)-like protein
LRAAGLHLLLGQPRQTLVAESQLRLRQGMVVLGGAALLLFVGVGWLAETGIRRQVGRIISMVRRTRRGESGPRIAQPYPRGELGELMAVLNGTAESLQQQRQAIDELGLRLRDAHTRELTERVQNEARLSRMANYDGLTGLPNRALFRDRLQQAVERSQRTGRPFALMFLDLDRFKNINDSLGHDVGDRLLVAVAEVLAGSIRATDVLARPREEMADEGIFRLGGDEFTFLVQGLSGSADVKGVAERILAALGRPFIVGEHELFISGSLGITVYAGGSVDLDGLIKQADMAMYRAKDSAATPTLLRRRLHREASRAPPARSLVAPRAGAWRVPAALPAQGRLRQWPGHRRGGAAALAAGWPRPRAPTSSSRCWRRPA